MTIANTVKSDQVITVFTNGNYVLGRLTEGETYNIDDSPPPGHSCVVVNGVGTMPSSEITVTVVCSLGILTFNMHFSVICNVFVWLCIEAYRSAH